MLQAESLLELNAFILHDIDPNITSYREQPAKIYFRQNGVTKTHYPDLLATTSNGHILKEIKSNREANDPDVLLRTKILQAYLPAQGYQYELLTESEIMSEPRLSNAKFIIKHARIKIPRNKKNWLINNLLKFDTLFWEELKNNKHFGTQIICRLILEGVLEIDMNSIWNENTKLKFSNQ